MVQKKTGLQGDKAKEKLKDVQGHIVLQPLDFLKDTLTIALKFRAPYVREVIKGGDAGSEFDPIC